MILAGRCQLWLPLNAFWGSEAKRTARLRPIPDEQPVINTTFASMVLTDQLKRREAEDKRAGFSLCFYIWLQGQLHVNIISVSATCSPPIISTYHHRVFSFCLWQTWESLLPQHKQKQSLGQHDEIFFWNFTLKSLTSEHHVLVPGLQAFDVC